MRISRSLLHRLATEVVQEVISRRLQRGNLLHEREDKYIYTQQGEYIPCWSPDTCEQGITLTPSQKKEAEKEKKKSGSLGGGIPASQTQVPRSPSSSIKNFPPQNDADARKLAKLIATNYMDDLPNDDRRSASVYLGTVHDRRGPDAILGDDDRVRHYVKYARGIADDPRGRWTVLRKELEEWAYAKILMYMDQKNDQKLRGQQTPEWKFVFHSAEGSSPESRAFRTKTIDMFEQQGDKIIAAVRPGPNRKARLASMAQARASDQGATRPAQGAGRKRKAQRKMAQASRKRNRPGNRHDGLAESLLETLLNKGFLRRLL